ncbi:MAG: putative nuclease (RecB family) [Ilumatobacteraceae bacterium]|nr:putative nuclease (RecB family) [Ilumatobacteraceae bacterium]
MFRLDDDWVFSATDLVTALRCEYQVLHKRAEKAGLVDPPDVAEDLVLERAAALGLAHEKTVLDRLVSQDGPATPGQPGGVVSIAQPSTSSRSQLEDAHAQTLAALKGGADVVYQAAFFHDGFHGLADFVVRVADEDGYVWYEPADTKLARHARVEALLQLAAYADQLVAMGFPSPREVHLWLGDGNVSSHRYADLQPILADRSERLRDLLAGPVSVPVWGDPHLRACGWCDHCAAAEKDSRDVVLVAGVRIDQRPKLVAAGIATIEDLAAATRCPPGIKQETFDKIRAQAVLQSGQDATRTEEDPLGVVSAELADPAGIALIPEPNPGDVFFDFEGDPLFVEAGWPDLGLEYLFGSITHVGPPEGGELAYWPLWAHDRRAEKVAVETYIDWLVARRATPGFEGMHVYHYAPYEVAGLKRMVQRYGTRSAELDQLLIDGVFVDLYSVVRRSIRISERSYSIKRLEPLYMGDELRTSEVAGGADSIIWYGNFTMLRAKGDLAEAQAQLDELASYNEYDCLSTLRLRDWLLSLPGGQRPAPRTGEASAERPPDSAEQAAAIALEQELLAPFATKAPGERTPEEQAVALLAAALLFHRRESLPFWWAHFARLAATVEDWEHDGEMAVLPPRSVEVVADWHVPEGKRSHQRTLTALAELPGSFKLSANSECHTIYDAPLPPRVKEPSNSDRGYRGGARLLALEPEGDRVRITFTESLPGGIGDEPGPEQAAVPVAISAGSPPPIGKLASAILGIASGALDLFGELRPHPALDILRRVPPRLRSGALPAVHEHDFATAITGAVRALDRSYLAVQGPPGTGKTTTGAEVIRRLVDSGWKVGIVAQGHKTIEAMMEKVIDVGVSPEQVVKRSQGGGDHRGLKLSDAKLRAKVTEPDVGCLVGGTKWDFVNENRIPAGSLDLVVIDEAGQFALADTIAVSQAAPRLLLLGDPQQLPQVSQARHPAPVQQAALDWLSDGRDTLPPELGYFLDTTYRMRPELAAVSSHLSYDDRLDADPSTAKRTIEGIEPGLHTVLVAHDSNRTASIEESRTVLRLVVDVVGRTWVTEQGDRPLDPCDILVVAPYNAQVNLIRTVLDDAGFDEVRVGTVDKFQGQEAPVVIVSMASSSASSGRGASFVLSRNRLNVALSRAQHTAYLVHSPQLTDLIPATPHALAQLGAFLGTSRSGRPAPGRP